MNLEALEIKTIVVIFSIDLQIHMHTNFLSNRHRQEPCEAHFLTLPWKLVALLETMEAMLQNLNARKLFFFFDWYASSRTWTKWWCDWIMSSLLDWLGIWTIVLFNDIFSIKNLKSSFSHFIFFKVSTSNLLGSGTPTSIICSFLNHALFIVFTVETSQDRDCKCQ